MTFSEQSYSFVEGIELAQPKLTLARPIMCCSVSVRVKVEDITAEGK